MNEIIYSINGKFLKDYQITVSKSDGFFDILKRKNINSYDWAEYNGSSPDLREPKFEPREIKLDCFVLGEDFDDMMFNFNSIFRDEFSKSGTQELLMQPFNYKERIYFVYLDGEIQLKKTFKKGKIAATFSVKLIEPNPIKKVLKLIGNSLNLSYNSTNQTELFYGNGLKDIVKSNASLSGKPISNRVLSTYNYFGRNLLLRSGIPTTNSIYPTSSYPLTFKPKVGDDYVLTLWGELGVGKLAFEAYNSGGAVHLGTFIKIKEGIYQAKFKWRNELNGATASDIDVYIFASLNTTIVDCTITKIKLEKGTSGTEWTIAPEEEKYIVIAGDINKITNLSSNATILWELS